MTLNALPSFVSVLDGLDHLITQGNQAPYEIMDTFNGKLMPSWYIRARRPCYRIHLVHKGCVEYTHKSGKVIELQAGGIILIGPNASFTARAISHHPWIGSVVFNPDREEDKPHPSKWWSAHFDISEWQFAFLNFMRLTHAQRTVETNLLDSTASSALHALFGLLYESVLSQEVKGTCGSAVLRVRRHMDTHPEEEFKLEALADLAQLNPYYLSRLFKQQIGMSLKSYHLESKMRYAHAILREGYVNVSELSEHLGYSEPSAFSRSFKAAHGIAPSHVSKKRESQGSGAGRP